MRVIKNILLTTVVVSKPNSGTNISFSKEDDNNEEDMDKEDMDMRIKQLTIEGSTEWSENLGDKIQKDSNQCYLKNVIHVFKPICQ